MIAARRLAAIVAINVAECLFWVTRGKPRTQHIFSGLPPITDL